MFIDTHTHLYDEQLTAEGDAVIRRAIEAGVGKMYMPNCDSSTIDSMMAIAAAWPQHCFPMMGLHPCYVKDNYEEELAIVEDWLRQQPFAAIGEIGLDYYWDKSFIDNQKHAFRRQIDLALEYGLPIVIHSRESTADCIEIVREKQHGSLTGIFHCFSGTVEEAKQIVALGLHLGIGGVVTFKKSNLPEVIAAIRPESIVLETDAPYLAPVPYRGKRNESSYIPIIAAKIAEIKNMDIAELGAVTTANAVRIFGTGR